MTKNRALLNTAVAVLVAFGISGRQELKAQVSAGPVGHVGRIAQLPVVPDDGSEALPTMYQGILAVGDNPPVGGSTPSWPCVGGTGDPECSKIAAGGVVFAAPYQLVPANANGEVYWTFTTLTATGTAKVKLTITQGATTIFTYNLSQSVTANGLWFGYVTGATLSNTTKGPATVTVTTTVGGATITGTTTIHVQ